MLRKKSVFVDSYICLAPRKRNVNEELERLEFSIVLQGIFAIILLLLLLLRNQFQSRPK